MFRQGRISRLRSLAISVILALAFIAIPTSARPLPATSHLASANAGYLLAGADGSVYGFGTSTYGSTYTDGLTGLTGAHPLAAPIVGMAATPNAQGYWMVGKDGGVFNFGNAHNYGSTYSYGITGLSGSRPLNAPIVGMAATPNGGGYWLVAADGGVFDFGNAGFYGSTYTDGLTGLSGAHPLNKPVVGITATPGGHGYWMVAADGGVFNFGSAPFLNSLGSQKIPAPIVAMVMVPQVHGYDVSNFNCQDLPNSPQGLMFVETNGYPFSFDYSPSISAGCGTASNGISQGLMAALQIAGNATQPYLFLGDNPNTANANPAVTDYVPSGCSSNSRDVGLTSAGTALPGWNPTTCQYDEPANSSAFATAPLSTQGCQIYASIGHSCSTPGPNFNFGWQQAIFGFDTATVNANAANLGGIVHNTWWLDVEGSGSWTGNGAGNYDAILGSIAALESLGASNVGVYSTNYQWSQITAGAPNGAALPTNTSLWVPDPGANPASVCQGTAGVNYLPFGGGTIHYVQYGVTSQFGGAIDVDASC
ncbi:MAG: glycoside hydrolase family 25 domain-containing protein [Ferrimicrobium sp.]